MANDYPMPRFHFQVDWGGAKINFIDMIGLNDEGKVIDYRHSDSKDFNKIKMPGMRKFSNITLKRGKFESDFNYNDWLDEVSNNKNKRGKIIIRLVDEKHEPVVVWKASRAFPVKITAPDLKSEGNEIDIESIEFSHEGLRAVPSRKKWWH